MFTREGTAPVRRQARVVSVAALLAFATVASAQIPGENVNMVSGTTWPGGDPYLQRQNEPSIAVSSANPLHLLAGANDYRTVDLPNPNSPDETGDAWLGLYKSFNGGQTWQSILLPGYPQDTSADGLVSPLHQNSAAADPVIRAGPNGMFYYSGITFNRGTNVGQVFVARFIDLNNKENGDVTRGADPIKYIDAHQVAAGGNYFVDKPWLAVDKPRLLSGTCTIPANAAKGIPAQSFKGGTIYLVYTQLVNSTNENVTVSSNILFSRSTDCGVTWSAPIQLNDASSTLNQGASVAVDPITGFIYATWRRYASGTQTDAIMVARSFRGFLFTRPRVLAQIIPTDQDGSPTTFRAEGFPTLAVSVDAAGQNSWVHVAWPQRPASCPYQPSGSLCDAQVAISTASVYSAPLSLNELLDDCHGWSTPVAADTTPITDDFGNAFTRGHQFMPQLTFSQGQLMLLYYDSHLDHTHGYYKPNSPFQLNAAGSYYTEERAPLGILPATSGDAPSLVFTPAIDDHGLTQERHTLDVRVAQAGPGPAPVFRSTRLSNFRFGERGDEGPNLSVPSFGANPIQVADANGLLMLQQLQANPPNLPMFAQGTTAFIGDYIDIQGPAFVPTSSGGWAFNTAPVAAPVFHAVWTSNQDVRPPPDGDWTKYTPPGGGGQSVFDPTRATPTCVTGYEGTRNQNVYTSRITNGLVVTSPQNVKPLSPTLTRAFVVAVQNATNSDHAVRISAAPPSGMTASFRNDGVSLLSFDVTVPAHSAVYRSLFATAGSPAASVTVNVNEVNPASPANCLGAIPPTCAIVPSGLSGSVTLNPPGSNPSLVQPDGTDPAGQNIANIELYAPVLGPSGSVDNTNFSNTNLSNTNFSNTNLSNTNLSNTNFSNTNLSNSSLAAAHISNAAITNLSNTNLSNTNFSNTNFSNTNLSNASIADANYVVTNTGNTTTSYHVKVAGNASGSPLQLIVSKNYTTPLGLNCQLVEEPRPAIISSIPNISSAIVPVNGTIADPNIPDPSATNATLSLAPGESAIITLRGVLTVDQMTQLASQITPVVIPHAGGSFAAALLIQSDATNLPTPQVGVPYAATLQAIGGTGPYTWQVSSGALPPGISLSGGQLAGTATQVGTFPFTLQVTDQSNPPGTVSKNVTLAVAPGPTIITLTASTTGPVFGQAVNLTATVSPQSSGPSPTGTVSFFLDGATTPAATQPLNTSGQATFSTSALSVGKHSFTASYSGDASYTSSVTGAAVGVTLAVAPTAISVSSSATPSVYGQPLTFTATVTAQPPGGGTPTGLVSFFVDGSASATATGTLNASGQATFSTSSLSASTTPHTIGANYAGDGNYAPSSAATISQPVNLASTATTLSPSVASSVVGQSVTLTATVTVTPPGAGTPAPNVTFADNGAPLATVQAWTNPSGGFTATYTTSTLALGSHGLSAVYGGDGSFASSTSAPQTFVVKAAPTSLALTSAPNPSMHGQAVTFTATLSVPPPGAGTPVGNVSFFVDGSPTAAATAALSGGQATFATSSLSTSTHSIAASFSSTDGNFAPSNASVSQAVTAAPTTTTVAPVAASVYGQATAISATVAAAGSGAGTPTGTVNFYDGANSIGSASLANGVATATGVVLPAGSHSITATYLGSTDFTGSSAGAAVTDLVSQATTTTSAAASPNPASYGGAVTFTAAVAVVSGGGTPVGTVQFLDGFTVLGTPTLSGSTASFTTTTPLSGGAHSVTATYLGTGNFAGSTSAALVEAVNPVPATGTLSASPAAPTYGQPVTLTATVVGGGTGTVAPTGSVTFTDGGATIGTAPLAGGAAALAVPLLSGGGHALTALYSGDGNYSSTTVGVLSLAVAAAATTTTLASSQNPITEGKSLTFTATVASPAGTPTGTVAFKDGTATLGAATLAGGKATFTTTSLQEGKHSITAVYAGTASFAASTSAVLSQTIWEDYRCGGFFLPLATAGTLTAPSKSPAQKQGSTVAVKWQLVKPSGTYVTRPDANLALQAVSDAGCAGTPAAGAKKLSIYTATGGAASGSAYSYDSTANQHVVNWGTSAASKGCYDIVYTPDNGTPQIVTIVQLK